MARTHLEVWLDASEIHQGLARVGTLYPHDVRTDLPPSFAYDAGPFVRCGWFGCSRPTLSQRGGPKG